MDKLAPWIPTADNEQRMERLRGVRARVEYCALRVIGLGRLAAKDAGFEVRPLEGIDEPAVEPEETPAMPRGQKPPEGTA